MNLLGAQILLILFTIFVIIGFVFIFRYILKRAEASELKNIEKLNPNHNKNEIT